MGAGFTVPANRNAVIFKLWAYSGDGSCRGQTGDQVIDWFVSCSGSCGSNVSLTAPGQTGDPPWRHIAGLHASRGAAIK